MKLIYTCIFRCNKHKSVFRNCRSKTLWTNVWVLFTLTLCVCACKIQTKMLRCLASLTRANTHLIVSYAAVQQFVHVIVFSQLYVHVSQEQACVLQVISVCVGPLHPGEAFQEVSGSGNLFELKQTLSHRQQRCLQHHLQIRRACPSQHTLQLN